MSSTPETIFSFDYNPAALAAVIANENQDVPTIIFMFWTSVWNTLAAILSPLVGLRMELIASTKEDTSEWFFPLFNTQC